MQDIADLAGVNKALLHYYFRSKDILFGKILDYYTSYLIPDLQNIVDLEVPILDKIELFVDKYIGFFQKNPDLPFFFMSEFNRNPQKVLAILANSNKFQYVQQFAFQMMLAMQEGKIKMINPRHLMLNVISMSVFPFIARPMIQIVMQIDDNSFTALLEERKKEISNFVRMALAV